MYNTEHENHNYHDKFRAFLHFLSYLSPLARQPGLWAQSTEQRGGFQAQANADGERHQYGHFNQKLGEQTT